MLYHLVQCSNITHTTTTCSNTNNPQTYLFGLFFQTISISYSRQTYLLLRWPNQPFVPRVLCLNIEIFGTHLFGSAEPQLRSTSREMCR
jgi:hypothetical protein